ncbi:MAG TPA: M14 family metallopeptidase [Gemmatimonadales bacterium]|nr:M14 family metallopeptidase [Gemmatimonadales bacterium]
MRPIVTLLALLAAAPAGAAQGAFDFYARGPYRPEIPRPAALLGYAPGSFHTTYGNMERVVDSVARAAADRVRVFEYGRSEEGRALRLIAVSAPEHITRLEEIRSRIQELADPRRTSAPRAAAIAANTPVLVWLNYANDGDESAAFEAAMQVLYHYAASEEPATLEALRQAVVLINPAHNPESHERFVAWYNAFGTGSADPVALEHDAPWGMETNNNHFQIDLNRDALGLTQQETRAIVAAMHRWRPQVFVDHHGQTEQMFFPPPALPVNAALPRKTRDWLERFGRGNAEAFDRQGWQYYVRDIFDLHYPGYWDSWPSLNGAIGMTYETDAGGNKGLAWRREDGSLATLEGGIARHFTASLATVETAARHREQLLRDYYAFRATGMAEARTARRKRVVLLPGRDPRRALDLAQVLVRHDIEVRRAAHPFSSAAAHDYLRPEAAATRRSFPAGALVVDLAQPQARLAAAVLDPQPGLDSAFVRQELDKAARNARRGAKAEKEREGFYDITAWALPLLYGVEAYWTEDAPPVAGDLLTLADSVAVPAPARARSAYVFVADGIGATALALRLAAEDFRVAVATRPLRADGRGFPRGTFVVRVERNPDGVHDRIARLARELSVEVFAAQTALPDTGGVGVGSESVLPLHRPRVAVLAGDGTSETGYGGLWFVLERRLGLRFTPFRPSAFGRLRLEDYNVLIIPHGGSGGAARRELFRGDNLARLKQWIEDGGALIAIKGGVVPLLDREVGLTSVRAVGETAGETKDEGPARFKPDTAAPLPPSAEPGPPAVSPTGADRAQPLFLPGVIARATPDRSHWLTYGYEQPAFPVLLATDRFLAPSREGDNPVVFRGPNVIVSGFEWPDNSERLLDGSVYAAVEPRGRGHVILFADDPTFRAFTQATWQLLANAILMGPGR